LDAAVRFLVSGHDAIRLVDRVEDRPRRRRGVERVGRLTGAVAALQSDDVAAERMRAALTSQSMVSGLTP
jgi:hypothetical protein